MHLELDDLELIIGSAGGTLAGLDHVVVRTIDLPENEHIRDWMGRVHCQLCHTEIIQGLVVEFHHKQGGYWAANVCRDRQTCKFRGAATSEGF